MATPPQGLFRGNLTVDPTSWHARMHRYWQTQAKYKGTGYRENLCHYVRVLLFWAPAAWVRHGRILKIPVWLYLALPAIAALLWAGFKFEPELTVDILIALGTVLGVVVMVVVGVLFYDDNPDRAKKVARVATFPLWILPFILFVVGLAIYDLTEKYLREFWYWFAYSRVLKVIYPWSVLVVVLAVGSFLFVRPAFWTMLQLLGLLALAAAAVLLIVGILLGLNYLDEKYKEKQKERQIAEGKGAPPREPSASRRALKGTVSGIQVAGHYAKAKKLGICPYISFSEPSENPQT